MAHTAETEAPGDAAAHGPRDPDDHVPHVAPRAAYLGVWAALMVLTVLTVAASRFDFGAMNLVIALGIATVKASLVALVFMHLFFDRRFNSLILVVGLLFLALFIGFTRMDIFSRGRADRVEGKRAVNVKDPFSAAGPAPAPRAE